MYKILPKECLLGIEYNLKLKWWILDVPEEKQNQEGAELCQAQPAKHKLFGFNAAISFFELLMVVLLNC